jgi:pSer/pThr/pTyr-binding forkhead associated (FHA) protein
MPRSPLGPHAGSPRDLQARMAADRRGVPYLVLRDDADVQRLVVLEDVGDRVTIGRDPGSAVALGWDPGVSRVHAQLERMGTAWTLLDDGLSRNGSFVNDQRVHGRRRLADGDLLRVGDTPIAFRDPTPATRVTVPAEADPPGARISPAQRRVLLALCRPFRDGSPFATSPTNQQIAEELHLSQDAVKTHLRALFDKLGVEDLPHNRKRARLAELAFQQAIIRPGELDGDP